MHVQYALDREWVEFNSAARIASPGEERSRDRVLSDDALRELWTGLQTLADQEEETDEAAQELHRAAWKLTYPFHDGIFTVTQCGRICFKGRKVNLSHVFAGQNVGVTQVGERIWLVTFMQYDLGYFDDETCRREPIENPFGPIVLPIRSE